ncbi:hypothetical protein DM828_15570 [Pseudomonas umsongensis]|nr:hypothetical protein [Pseudomonas umsongensis]
MCCFWRSRCSGIGTGSRIQSDKPSCPFREQARSHRVRVILVGASLLAKLFQTGGNRHSIGVSPFCSRNLLVRLKCPHPRKPR